MMKSFFKLNDFVVEPNMLFPRAIHELPLLTGLFQDRAGMETGCPF
jgi:hypothetical protein